MKQLIIISMVLTISTISALGQITLRYEKIIEFVYDEMKDDYIQLDSILLSGIISFDSKKIYIREDNSQPNKIFIINTKEKEEDTNRDIYRCEMEGERYIIAVSPDRYLTQIGINNKFIYELSPRNKEIKPEVIFIKLNQAQDESSQKRNRKGNRSDRKNISKAQ